MLAHVYYNVWPDAESDPIEFMRILTHGYNPGDRLEHVHTWEVAEPSQWRGNESLLDVCEYAFAWLNGMADQPMPGGIRSMCVGDVVTVADHMYACMGAGWKRIR